MDGINTSVNTILKNLIKNFNTLLDCPVRFAGEYDSQKVHNFIEYIEHYKRIKCIGDEQALQELQFLLLDKAHIWWLRRKLNLSTWSEALTLLENHFSKKRPAYELYTEILKSHYNDYESKDDFIEDKVELFNELSQPKLREENKLDLIYALLPNEIQQKLKIINIRSIKELKEQLKLVKLDSLEASLLSNQEHINLNAESALKENVVSTDVQTNSNDCNTKSYCLSSTEINEDERDPIIKVRRTEDLMPTDIKEEETPIQQDKLLRKDTETSITNKHSNNDDFEIDNDIMNQINNIIDESEMSMNTANDAQITASNLPEPSNSVTSFEFVGFHIEATLKPDVVNSNITLSDNNKSLINTTKKVKLRCSYCRKGNHTAQACFKKAKHMKQFPERFTLTKPKQKQDNLPSNSCDNPISSLSLSTTTNTFSTNCNNTSTQPTVTTTPIFLHPITSTSLIANSSTVTSVSTVILNNGSEKTINPTLTTKLIAPINGKTSSKILAAKLRNINTPSSKCHQCGTVGFYKSICPNCSPIYNSNNNHSHYNK